MANLYNLATEYEQLYNALIETADEETGEVDLDISKALEKAQGTFEEKAIATAIVSRKLTTYSEQIGNEIKRLQTLKKHVDSEYERVEKYLSDALKKAGIESIKGVYANISFKNTPLKTVIDDESLIPEDYITVKVERKPNLTAIKEAIKAGKEIQGAHLESERKIQIK